MKRIVIFLTALFLVASLCGCSMVEVDGIENFSSMESSLELNYNLFPGNEEFLTSYPYISAIYKYNQNDTVKSTKAKSFVKLTYSESVYETAKEHCIMSFQFAERQYLHDGFLFMERIYDEIFSYPESMCIFAYNDAAHQLMFFRYLNTGMNDESKQMVLNDFGRFFDQEFKTD